MEAYPPEYVEHNLPLIHLSGLGEPVDPATTASKPSKQEYGTRIPINSPVCRGERAAVLLQEFLRQDGQGQAWNSTAQSGVAATLKYRMKTIGRTYTLPARKAAPLPQSPSADGLASAQLNALRGSELHSPLSPLSPSSPIYTDGVFTPLWFAKHQQQVPCVFLAFFALSSADGNSQNEQVQIDINAIKTAIGRSGFKTRLAVVLMSDRSILQAPELEDWLSATRRATSLDAKTGLFFMPPMSSQPEIATFVHAALAALQPLCLEYYRELTKHVRRKKTRGGPPPQVLNPAGGVSRSLSAPSWNARYETKQGVFAEFRQEMDVAERHYSAAIEDLFHTEGVFETTTIWSPRWDEARLLSDTLALRVVRCQIWNRLTTGAVISWVNYKARMKDLIDRRGRGSQTYGWAAWESRWARIMAQLIRRAQLAVFERTSPEATHNDSGTLTVTRIFAPPEDALATMERLPPFCLMHHPGYWFRLAFEGARLRLEFAMAIPEEDRLSPNQSHASTATPGSRKYDLYLVPDPYEEAPTPGHQGYDHLTSLRRLAEDAIFDFEKCGQVRSSARLQLDLARILYNSQHYDQALDILRTLWSSSTWRDDDWTNLFAELLIVLQDCARREENGELVLTSCWELLAVPCSAAHGQAEDLHVCLAGLHLGPEKLALSLDGRRLCPVTISFGFADRETNVGDVLECQFVLTSKATHSRTPLTFKEVQIELSDGKSMKLSHQDHDDNDQVSQHFAVHDLTTAAEVYENDFNLQTNLRLDPGTQRVYTFCLTFKEANTIQLRNVDLAVEGEAFIIQQTLSANMVHKLDCLQEARMDRIEPRWLLHSDTHTVTVRPKPPKINVLVSGLRKQYYTDEILRVDVELINGESEDVNGTAQAVLTTGQEDPVILSWIDGNTRTMDAAFRSLSRAASYKATLVVNAPPDPTQRTLVIDAQYTLASEPDTILTKRLSIELDFVPLIEVDFDFSPLLHAEPWPSFYDAGAIGSDGKPSGIPQRWRLGSLVKSLAAEDTTIHSVRLFEDESPRDARIEIHNAGAPSPRSFKAGHPIQIERELTTRKLSLDDRRSTVLELSLEIQWSHQANSMPATTTIPVPRLTLPSSEPRVLCTATPIPVEAETMILHYHIENPSTHFLTFALTMEASVVFAFSGPKYRALSLAPLSRHCVEYRLLVHDVEALEREDGSRWIWPVLQVVDSYYQKNLRVQAGGLGVRIDEKRGIAVKVDAAE